ncbi:Trypsin Inhibitor like cysteine rich domain [Popillia japonica]|uniref:Trypsin Inhibitor like cysteine rich domain n=1 Tax=Popillia japonica TaxID=7064 RepID=A0AAW1NDM0_POPJA
MGLFGTYSDDPDDDFMTPSGQIVNDALTFGNSWKTESSCPDQLIPTPHPCDLNPSARPAAEKICSAVKGDIFQRCNISDIDAVYENCVYDTCLCQDNPNKCSCDNIEVAAEVCGRQGIITDWRQKIPECAIQCPPGQVYQECGDSCARTCEDLSMRPDCFPRCVEGCNCAPGTTMDESGRCIPIVPRCVEGCNCAPGTTMDESGRCIPIEECKCRIKNIVYPPGFQYLKNNTVLLTCENARWNQTVPTPEQQKTIPTEAELQERCSRFDFMDYTPCKYPDPKTCQNMDEFEIMPIPKCEEGCECTDGFVLDEVSKFCVRPEECPCFDRGHSYEEGNVVIKEGCNRCVCMRDGSWDCKEEDCSSVCVGIR